MLRWTFDAALHMRDACMRGAGYMRFSGFMCSDTSGFNNVQQKLAQRAAYRTAPIPQSEHQSHFRIERHDARHAVVNVVKDPLICDCNLRLK